MNIVSIMSLVEGDQFRLYLGKSLENSISELVRYEEDDTPICKRVANYWTDREEWVVPDPFLVHEEKWNPSAYVEVGKLVDGKWIPIT